MFTRLSTCILALAAFAHLLDGLGFSSVSGSGSSIGVFVGAAPTLERRHEGGEHGGQDARKFKFAREDDETPTDEESTETLGKLLNDYDLLRAAVPATTDGSDLQSALIEEINHKKEIIFQKFGQIVPEDGAPDSTPPATTVSSADGSVMTIYPIPSGSGIIIAQDGQNTTVSLGNEQLPATPTAEPTPTSTSTVVTVSTSTASPTVAGTSAGTTATTASVSPSTKHNDAGILRPFDILPTTIATKSLLIVAGATAFGAWTVL